MIFADFKNFKMAPFAILGALGRDLGRDLGAPGRSHAAHGPAFGAVLRFLKF